MKRALLLAASAFLTLSATATELGGFYWLLTPEGTATIGRKGIIGTQFDMENDLGYGDTIGSPGGTLILGDVLQFGVSVFQSSGDASETITKDIQFRDLHFRERSEVTSEFEALFGRGFLRIGTPGEDFQIGVEGGVMYADLSASAKASGIGSATSEAQAGMPYAGLFLNLKPVDSLSLQAEGRLSKWEISDYEVDYQDIEVSARLHMDAFYLGGGYRSLNIQVVDGPENLDVDLTFKGPVVYAGFTW